MTTTTVEIDAFYPNGSPCVGREVSIRVVDGGAGASTGDGLLADQWTVRLDAAGHGEVDLPPNDELTPAGTFYRLSLIGASLVRDIEVPVTDETISWADASVQVSPGVPPTFVQSVCASSGLLTARPDATSVPGGYIYTATDTNGGTVYVSTGSAWLEIASANSAVAGKIIASANPSSASTLAASFAGTRVPELTTATFTMPDAPCTVTFGRIAFTNVSSAGLAVQVRWSSDGWSTSNSCGQWTEVIYDSGNSASIVFGSQCRLVTAGTGATPAVGASVQVGLFVAHPSDTSVSPAILGAFQVVCLLEVRAG